MLLLLLLLLLLLHASSLPVHHPGVDVQVLEHTWHMIFGAPAVLPAVPECELIDCELDGGQVKVWGYGGASN